jgi:hypothetical protein
VTERCAVFAGRLTKSGILRNHLEPAGKSGVVLGAR